MKAAPNEDLEGNLSAAQTLRDDPNPNRAEGDGHPDAQQPLSLCGLRLVGAPSVCLLVQPVHDLRVPPQNNGCPYRRGA